MNYFTQDETLDGEYIICPVTDVHLSTGWSSFADPNGDRVPCAWKYYDDGPYERSKLTLYYGDSRFKGNFEVEIQRRNQGVALKSFEDLEVFTALTVAAYNKAKQLKEIMDSDA